ncbi:alpha/beta fold hydrolase [Cryptosporangium aurantiacum]|uniref:Pimeloyl-ACP methyl ester carboxylesterase n=1 Tax=Cryptosporangium aurantiacum TaxID=134849 RepID=A0A1M7L2M6_9ACTN|nr:alpha/beta fold hydrolase [Cryptosporangium aurantiacum]SHM72069.1 Pimeloyl-ACP methyl ester carboxylesterase [Cryptosporangium aurantiacum]
MTVPAADGLIATPVGNLAYTIAGAGEPLLLIHGLGGTRRTWRHLIDSLATDHTVIAADLPGHGHSDAPAGDYSLGAHASALRDLLVALGHSDATLVGHSLGGGIALQFAYQFPERTNRIVLISSGGLGTEVTPLLRAATLPGAAAFVAGLGRIPTGLTRRVLPALSVLPGVIARQDTRPIAEDLRGLAHPRQRRAFLRTARTVIDWRGQTVSASRQLSLLAELPVFITWGSRDRTIPPHHHQALARRIPEAHSLEISTAGHYPHETAPEQLLPAVHEFLRTTQPYRYDEERWRQLVTGAGALDEPKNTLPLAV